MIWNNKIESCDRFSHIGRYGTFVCYYGDDKWVYPADKSVEWLRRMDEHIKFLKSDCKKHHNIYFPKKITSREQLESIFKALYVNPYFFRI